MSATAYRTATAEGASHLGLLLATYDVLAEDIRLAGEAAARNDIEERCRRSGHAVLLLGHLESWVPLLEDTALEAGLIRFYSYIRAELMRLQSSGEAAGFAELALQVSETRAAWQQKGDTLRAAQAVQVPSAEMLPPDTVGADNAPRLSFSA